MATKTERIVRYLEKSGFRERPCKSRKYRKFVKGDAPLNSKLNRGRHIRWVGRNGAVRIGPTISDSISISHFYNEKLLALKEKNHEANT